MASFPAPTRNCAPYRTSRGAIMNPAFPSAHRPVGQLAIVLAALAIAAPNAQSGRTHDLRLLPENVHWGYYDASVRPVLRIASGDTVRVETMVARGLQRLRAAGVTGDEIPDPLKAVERAITDRGP